MQPDTLDEFTCEVFLQVDEPLQGGLQGYHWVGLHSAVNPITWDNRCDPNARDEFDGSPQPDEVTGVQILPHGDIRWPAGKYLVVLRGDAILALKDGPTLGHPNDDGPRALDGNHLGPGIYDRCPSGDEIEGGKFESWFTITERG
jgi:hypothetical protein